jgi:hypothetical protein
MHERPEMPALKGTQRSRRRLACLTSASALLLGMLAVVTASPSAANHTCDPNDNTFTWDGDQDDSDGSVGDNLNWWDPHNWDQNCVPGQFGDGPFNGGTDDVVTIPAGKTVLLAEGDPNNSDQLGWQYLASLNNLGTLTIGEPGSPGRLHVDDPSTSANMVLDNGFVGGRGSLTVTGTLVSQNVTTQTTRHCHRDVPPPGPLENCRKPVVGTKGRTIIAPGATWSVNGPVNLQDQRVIENRGQVTLSGAGYIAADDGTAFRNFGSFDVDNDRGYYQGFTSAADDPLGLQNYYAPNCCPNWSAVGLSKFNNSGSVRKTGGPGTSMVAADYTDTLTGQVVVGFGTLSILTPNGDSTVRSADVDGGSTFGNAGPGTTCEQGEGAGCSMINPTGADRKVVTVEVTKTDSLQPTEVNIAEDAPGVNKPVDITTPDATADGAVSFSEPLRFRIYLQLAPTGDPATVAKSAPVYRNGVKLPKCDATSQNPTQDDPTCVARRLSKGETADPAFAGQPGQDVVIVISSVQNSRYRVGA